MKRAQAALEYIATYGWALMAVLISIGALAYFGAFDIDSFRGSSCTFPPGFVCEDFIIRGDGGGEAVAQLRNNYGVELDISSVTASEAGGGISFTCPATYPDPFPSEAVANFECDWDDPTLYAEGQTYEVEMTIEFTQSGGTYTHTTTGVVATTAQ